MKLIAIENEDVQKYSIGNLPEIASTRPSLFLGTHRCGAVSRPLHLASPTV